MTMFRFALALTLPMICFCSCDREEKSSSADEERTRSSKPTSSERSILSADKEGRDSKADQSVAEAAFDFESLLAELTRENVLESLQRCRESPDWPRYRGAFYQHWASFDARAAADQARGHEPNASPGLVNVVLSAWAAHDTKAAVAWIDDLGETRGREVYAEGVLRGVSDEDLGDMGDWVAGFGADRLSRPLFSRYGQELYQRQSPGEAVAWLSALPAGQSGSAALESVLLSWSKDDPEAAGNFLSDLEDSTFRNEAIGVFSRTVVREDPEAALAWAEVITDKELQAAVFRILEGEMVDPEPGN